MSTPSAGANGAVIVWRPVEIRAFAHEVATTANELREVTPLLRALADLRVPADRAGPLQRELATLTQVATRLKVALERDVTDLWAGVGASAEMEATVTAILTARPYPKPQIAET